VDKFNMGSDKNLMQIRNL